MKFSRFDVNALQSDVHINGDYVFSPNERRHRFVEEEPDIPFEFDVLYENSEIIVIDKPHFLPTIPRGMWYRSSALIQLRERLGEPLITPAHRLDRATAGVVVFVRNKSSRGAYQMLFQRREVTKIYDCVAEKPCNVNDFPRWRHSHIMKLKTRMQALETSAEPNAHTYMTLLPEQWRWCGKELQAYRLYPKTGKTHQLRVHMNALGLPILGDDMYPTARKKDPDDFAHPLQLVARTLQFVDPLTGEERIFHSRIPLMQGTYPMLQVVHASRNGVHE